jgi:predicted dehydrogenase
VDLNFFSLHFFPRRLGYFLQLRNLFALHDGMISMKMHPGGNGSAVSALVWNPLYIITHWLGPIGSIDNKKVEQGVLKMAEKERDVSRRSFVKTGAMATAAISAFHVLKSHGASAKPLIKIGVIGCGGRGREAMKDALRADDAVRIVALADIFPEKMELAKEELNKFDHPTNEIETFLGFKSYQELVKTDCDYVILATPPCYRPETLEAAVAAKKHVFMEKPAAVDPQGIRRIIAAGEKAKELGLSIAAGTQRRHQKEYIEAVNRMHDGAIGEIVNMQIFWAGGPIGFPKRKEEWSEVEWQIRGWYHWLWLSGDHILEQHVHNIDVANWIMGAHPIKAFGVGGCGWQERGNIWDHHAVHFLYPNGVDILSMCSQHPRKVSRVDERAQGTKGRSFTAQGGPWYLQDRHGKELWRFEGEKSAPYVQEHADLMDSIRNNKGLNEARNVAESTMTAMMGRMAEYTGDELTWEEALHSDEQFPIYYEFGDVDDQGAPAPGGQKYTGEEGWQPG